MKLIEQYPKETLEAMEKAMPKRFQSVIAKNAGCSRVYVAKVFTGEVEVSDLVLKIISCANDLIRKRQDALDRVKKRTDKLLNEVSHK